MFTVDCMTLNCAESPPPHKLFRNFAFGALLRSWVLTSHPVRFINTIEIWIKNLSDTLIPRIMHQSELLYWDSVENELWIYGGRCLSLSWMRTSSSWIIYWTGFIRCRKSCGIDRCWNLSTWSLSWTSSATGGTPIEMQCGGTPIARLLCPTPEVKN